MVSHFNLSLSFGSFLVSSLAIVSFNLTLFVYPLICRSSAKEPLIKPVSNSLDSLSSLTALLPHWFSFTLANSSLCIPHASLTQTLLRHAYRRQATTTNTRCQVISTVSKLGLLGHHCPAGGHDIPGKRQGDPQELLTLSAVQAATHRPPSRVATTAACPFPATTLISTLFWIRYWNVLAWCSSCHLP